jgi:hypothetical protein
MLNPSILPDKVNERCRARLTGKHSTRHSSTTAGIRGQPFGGACEGSAGRLFTAWAEYAPQTLVSDFINPLLIGGSDFYGGAIKLLLDGRKLKPSSAGRRAPYIVKNFKNRLRSAQRKEE